MKSAHLPILEPADRTLIETAIARRFDLHALLDPSSPHPAQHSFLSLATWIMQPHIQAATDLYLAAMHRAACCAHALDINQQIQGLKTLFLSALSLLKHTSDLPSDPAHVPKAARDLRTTIREARLLFSALKSLTRPPRLSRSKSLRPTSDTPPLPQHAADHHHTHSSPASLDHPDSTTPNQSLGGTNPPNSSINNELHLLHRALQDGLDAFERDFITINAAQPPDPRLNNSESLLQTAS